MTEIISLIHGITQNIRTFMRTGQAKGVWGSAGNRQKRKVSPKKLFMLLNKAKFIDKVFAPDIKTYIKHGSA